MDEPVRGAVQCTKLHGLRARVRLIGNAGSTADHRGVRRRRYGDRSSDSPY